MEGLEAGKWEKIPDAADVTWNDDGRSLEIGVGADMNGVRWAGPLPVVPYEIELDARRLLGGDFFCALTFPARSEKECLTLVVGGWGGSLVGVSSLDDLDASENSTASQREFSNNRWYHIRVAVGTERLQAWIDTDQVVDLETTGRKLSLRPGPIEACAPFGLATWITRGEVRGVRWRKLTE